MKPQKTVFFNIHIYSSQKSVAHHHIRSRECFFEFNSDLHWAVNKKEHSNNTSLGYSNKYVDHQVRFWIITLKQNGTISPTRTAHTDMTITTNI